MQVATTFHALAANFGYDEFKLMQDSAAKESFQALAHSHLKWEWAF